MTKGRVHFHTEDEASPDWILVEGTVTHFFYADAVDDVLQVLKRGRAKGGHGAGKYAAALERFAGYDIVVGAYEYEESFACLVGSTIVCGAYCGAWMLSSGDKVRIVASPMAEGQCYAIAVERAKDGLLWLPKYSWRGAHADASFDAVMHVQAPVWFGLFCVMIVLFTLGMLSNSAWMHYAAWAIILLLLTKVSTSVLDFPVKDRAPHKHEGSKIFRMLAYPDPDNLDLSCVRLDAIDPETGWRTVYRYQDGLRMHAGPADEPPKKRKKKGKHQ